MVTYKNQHIVTFADDSVIQFTLCINWSMHLHCWPYPDPCVFLTYVIFVFLHHFFMCVNELSMCTSVHLYTCLELPPEGWIKCFELNWINHSILLCQIFYNIQAEYKWQTDVNNKFLSGLFICVWQHEHVIRAEMQVLTWWGPPQSWCVQVWWWPLLITAPVASAGMLPHIPDIRRHKIQSTISIQHVLWGRHLMSDIIMTGVVLCFLPWNRRSLFCWPGCFLWRESAWSRPAPPL